MFVPSWQHKTETGKHVPTVQRQDFQCSAECTKGYYEIKGDAWDNGLGGFD